VTARREIEEVLRDLARESGKALAELGVRASDERWIGEHARTIASLAGAGSRMRLTQFWRRYRSARQAARTAR
jgi:hypothetical protein